MKLHVIYRCCELDTKLDARPRWFSKLKCLDNLLGVFKYDPQGITKEDEIILTAVHDGEKGQLHTHLDFCDINIEKINLNSNAGSLQYCLDFAAKLPQTDVIYFVEDDYLHTDDAFAVLKEGFEVADAINKDNVISLYDHLDRLLRTDDIDFHQTLIRLGNLKYWRTAESTTCTWAISQGLYLDKVYKLAKSFGLQDRELFRFLRKNHVVLFTPMLGASTHCHEPFLSPFVDWSGV
ncbi:MAG TPA: hypothetical protein PKX31_00110 [Chitinophagaceae bacterium]|nr:hypothetical protein [Chitinophagaceae bacterium]